MTTTFDKHMYFKILFADPSEPVQLEDTSLKKFMKFLKDNYPEFAKIAIHTKNEGRRSISAGAKHMAKGQVKGTADIIIPAKSAFVLELKSENKYNKATEEQIEYLISAAKLGATCYLCYGFKQAIKAFLEWYEINYKN